MLYRVMIVDDEEATRRGIGALPLWPRLGIEVAALAPDGQAALACMDEALPDMLLTDVKMPGMDGIELARLVKRRCPKLKLAFMSGYDDVRYLKSALQVSATDYILKPVDPAELEQCFRRMVDELDREGIEQSELQALLVRYTAGALFLRDHLFGLLLFGSIGRQGLEQVLQVLGERFSERCFAVFALKAAGGAAEDGVIPLVDPCESFCDERYVLPVDRSEGRYAAVLVTGRPIPPALLAQAAARVVRKLKEAGVRRAALGYAPRCGSIFELQELHARAAEALRHWFCEGDGAVLSAEAPPAPEEREPEIPPPTDLEALLSAPGTGALEGYIEALFRALQRSGRTDKLYFINCLSRHLSAVNDVLCRHCRIQPEDALSLSNVLDAVSQEICLPDMREVFARHCVQVGGILSSRLDNTTRQSIARVRRHMMAHYGEHLTIQALADLVHLAPTYLCILFREETGRTIGAYLTELRMERAKALLAREGCKLYDVGLQVGYPNPSYFARQFKKYTGLTPSEYRDRRPREDV